MTDTTPRIPTKFAGLPIRKPSEIQQHRGTCITLTGKGGVGKTTLAATITHSDIAQRCLFVDLEGGAHVLDDDPYMDIVEVHSWSELEVILQSLVRDTKTYRSVIIDNASEALELCKAKYNFYADITKQLSLWNQITNDMVTMFRTGRDIARQEQFVTIFCMWDTIDNEDDMGQKFKHRNVSLNPKLAEKFLGIMDIVGWLEQPTKPNLPYPPILHFDIDPLYPTKKRISPRQQSLLKIPDIIYNPDLGHIIDTMIGGKPWPTEQHQKPTGRSASDVQAIIQARKNSQ